MINVPLSNDQPAMVNFYSFVTAFSFLTPRLKLNDVLAKIDVEHLTINYVLGKQICIDHPHTVSFYILMAVFLF